MPRTVTDEFSSEHPGRRYYFDNDQTRLPVFLVVQGVDAEVPEGGTATLDGSFSFSERGPITSYKWEQVSGTQVPIVNATSAIASSTAPDVDADTVLVFKLTASDGTDTRSDDNVRITVKNVVPGPVRVPDVVGESRANAGSMIRAAGLVVGTITEVYSDTVAAGYVISQNPTAGTEVPEGVSVDLTISLGPSDGPPQPAGLVAHWTFDENSGTTVTDLVGGVVGNVINATWTGGLFSGSGAALEFDGSSAYVNVPGEDWGTFKQVSISLWLKFDSLPDPHNSLFHEDWSPGGIHFMVRGSGVVCFSLNGRGPNDFNSAAVLEAGETYHVVVTFDITTGKTQIYINGVLDSEAVSSASATEIFLRSPFTIGSWNTERYWHGVLDDLRIYDYALSENEIKALARIEELLVPYVVGMSLAEATTAITSGGLAVGTVESEHSDTILEGYVIRQNPPPGTSVGAGSNVDLTISLGPAGPGELQACCFADGSCEDLTAQECPAQGGTAQGEGTSCVTTDCAQPRVDSPVAHWKLDEAQDTVAYDSAGINDAVLYGNPTWQPIGGIIDGALDFDGDGDYVVNDNFGSLLNGLDALTVALWVKSDVTNTDKGFIHFEDPFGADNRGMRYDAMGATGGGVNVIKIGVTSDAAEGPPAWPGRQQLESSSDVQTTDWQHLAMTWSTGQQLKLYINGVLDTPMANAPALTGLLTGYTKVIIGKGGKDETADAGWDGLLDDVRIYDYALSADQIVQLLCDRRPRGDLNRDCKVNLLDLVILASSWLDCGLILPELCGQ